MISYVLDTNAVISVLSSRSGKLTERVYSHPQGALALPSVVAHELYFGIYRSQRVEENFRRLRLLLQDIPMLDFNANDALVSGEVRAFLAARGTSIGPYDTLISGQAKARGLTVVTNNVREFSRVPDLKVEDWTL